MALSETFRVGGKNTWQWKSVAEEGAWQVGYAWTRPFLVVAPWIMLMLILVLFMLLGQGVGSAQGCLCALPETRMDETDVPGLVALITVRTVALTHEPLVFFDDARYRLEESACAALCQALSTRAREMDTSSLLILADQSVDTGNLMKFIALVRRSGITRVLIAEKGVGSGDK